MATRGRIKAVFFEPGDDPGAFLHEAHRARADLIVMTPDLRGGILHRRRRDAAQKLLLESPIPVLAIGPKVAEVAGLRRILFATDFGPDAEEVFDEVLTLADRLGAKITVFHAAEIPVGSPVSRSARPLQRRTGPASSVWRETWAKKLRQLEVYVLRAKSDGLQATSYLDVSGLRLVDGLLSAGHQVRAELLALPRRSGPAHSILRGNTVREVIRRADRPVWVLRGQARQRRRKLRTA